MKTLFFTKDWENKLHPTNNKSEATHAIIEAENNQEDAYMYAYRLQEELNIDGDNRQCWEENANKYYIYGLNRSSKNWLCTFSANSGFEEDIVWD